MKEGSALRRDHGTIMLERCAAAALNLFAVYHGIPAQLAIGCRIRVLWIKPGRKEAHDPRARIVEWRVECQQQLAMQAGDRRAQPRPKKANECFRKFSGFVESQEVVWLALPLFQVRLVLHCAELDHAAICQAPDVRTLVERIVGM